MMVCVCGHVQEEHRWGGECEATTTFSGRPEPCRCVMYEEQE